jgi:hypothetical protein
MTMNKTCIVCGAEKDISEFYKNPHVKDGHEGRCKECRKSYQADYRKDNPEKIKQASVDYYASHKEERSKYYKQWRTENAEYKAMSDLNYRHSHPEKMKVQRKIENAKRRARIVNALGRFTSKEWNELKSKYGNKCLKCGKEEPEVKITPDHVIPLALGGTNTIDNIQPLCWGCNAAKQARIADYRNG